MRRQVLTDSARHAYQDAGGQGRSTIRAVRNLGPQGLHAGRSGLAQRSAHARERIVPELGVIDLLRHAQNASPSHCHAAIRRP
jgi:hypothetical protein